VLVRQSTVGVVGFDWQDLRTVRTSWCVFQASITLRSVCCGLVIGNESAAATAATSQSLETTIIDRIMVRFVRLPKREQPGPALSAQRGNGVGSHLSRCDTSASTDRSPHGVDHLHGFFHEQLPAFGTDQIALNDGAVSAALHGPLGRKVASAGGVEPVVCVVFRRVGRG